MIIIINIVFGLFNVFIVSIKEMYNVLKSFNILSFKKIKGRMELKSRIVIEAFDKSWRYPIIVKIFPMTAYPMPIFTSKEKRDPTYFDRGIFFKIKYPIPE